MKLGIYGGTFNPPHLGHLTSARLALDALGLDELRFVPAALPPHKRLPPDAPGPEARLEMVELAADGLLLPGRVSVFVPALKKSFAELSPAEKNAISHRGNALTAFREKLEQYLNK